MEEEGRGKERETETAKDSNEIPYFNGGSMVESPNRVEKDATCEGMHSFCTGHKTFLRC